MSKIRLEATQKQLNKDVKKAEFEQIKSKPATNDIADLKKMVATLYDEVQELKEVLVHGPRSC